MRRPIEKANKQSAAVAPKKPRKDKNTPITPEAFAVLEVAKKLGHAKTAFASAAIISHGRTLLGDAVPVSPADLYETRLSFLEYAVSATEWDTLCADNPKRAEYLRRRVAEAGHSPYARNFEALNKLMEARGKSAVVDEEWIVVSFAEKHDFPWPSEIPDMDD